MTICSRYWVRCSDCGRECSECEESPEDAKIVAAQEGYHINVLVPNGSLWDFCSRCWVSYKETKDGNK